jgi:DNA-binding FadR family transcriptional regulator
MSVEGHRAIYSAVAAGDDAGAIKAMTDHLHEVAALVANTTA